MLVATLVPALALAASPQVKAELTCDGSVLATRSGDASDVRGWANKTFASYRKTCQSGSLLIWVGWDSEEPKVSRSF
jgi:hypothetical protein